MQDFLLWSVKWIGENIEWVVATVISCVMWVLATVFARGKQAGEIEMEKHDRKIKDDEYAKHMVNTNVRLNAIEKDQREMRELIKSHQSGQHDMAVALDKLSDVLTEFKETFDRNFGEFNVVKDIVLRQKNKD